MVRGLPMTSDSSPPPPLSADAKGSEEPSIREPASDDPSTDENSPQAAADPRGANLEGELATDEREHTPQNASSAQLEGPVWSPEAWGQAARATCLSALLGMALVVFVRLGLGGDWVSEMLGRNKLPMPDRTAFLYQMVGGALITSLLPLAFTIFSKVHRWSAATWEKWAWFLSPL